MLDIMVKVTFKIYVGQQMILPFFINFVNIFPPTHMRHNKWYF